MMKKNGANISKLNSNEKEFPHGYGTLQRTEGEGKG
jgi:antitoxin component YwqK of YwqJK toxin-antitoxin module